MCPDSAALLTPPSKTKSEDRTPSLDTFSGVSPSWRSLHEIHAGNSEARLVTAVKTGQEFVFVPAGEHLVYHTSDGGGEIVSGRVRDLVGDHGRLFRVEADELGRTDRVISVHPHAVIEDREIGATMNALRQAAHPAWRELLSRFDRQIEEGLRSGKIVSADLLGKPPIFFQSRDGRMTVALVGRVSFAENVNMKSKELATEIDIKVVQGKLETNENIVRFDPIRRNQARD